MRFILSFYSKKRIHNRLKCHLYIFLYRKSNAFFSFYRKTNAFFFSLPKFTQIGPKTLTFFSQKREKKARFDKPPALLKLLYFLPLITGHNCLVFTSAISTLGYWAVNIQYICIFVLPTYMHQIWYFWILYNSFTPNESEWNWEN